MSTNHCVNRPDVSGRTEKAARTAERNDVNPVAQPALAIGRLPGGSARVLNQKHNTSY